MENRYIYRLILSSGKTYIGQRLYKCKYGINADTDTYMGSSLYIKNHKEDSIIKKEILIENIKDAYTLNLLETICIMHEFAYNKENCINGNYGAYYYNYAAPNHIVSESTKKLMSESAKKSWTKERKQRAHESGKYSHKHLTENDRKKCGEKNKGKIFIVKNNKSIKVTKEELDKYLKNGWKLGVVKFTKEHLENLKKSAKNKGLGSRWLIKNDIKKKFKPFEIQNAINNGWNFTKRSKC